MPKITEMNFAKTFTVNFDDPNHVDHVIKLCPLSAYDTTNAHGFRSRQRGLPYFRTDGKSAEFTMTSSQ